MENTLNAVVFLEELVAEIEKKELFVEKISYLFEKLVVPLTSYRVSPRHE